MANRTMKVDQVDKVNVSPIAIQLSTFNDAVDGRRPNSPTYESCKSFCGLLVGENRDRTLQRLKDVIVVLIADKQVEMSERLFLDSFLEKAANVVNLRTLYLVENLKEFLEQLDITEKRFLLEMAMSTEEFDTNRLIVLLNELK